MLNTVRSRTEPVCSHMSHNATGATRFLVDTEKLSSSVSLGSIALHMFERVPVMERVLDKIIYHDAVPDVDLSSRASSSTSPGTLSPATSMTKELVIQRSGSKLSDSEEKSVIKDEAPPGKIGSQFTGHNGFSNHPTNEGSKVVSTIQQAQCGQLDRSIQQAVRGLPPSQQLDSSIQHQQAVCCLPPSQQLDSSIQHQQAVCCLPPSQQLDSSIQHQQAVCCLPHSQQLDSVTQQGKSSIKLADCGLRLIHQRDQIHQQHQEILPEDEVCQVDNKGDKAEMSTVFGHLLNHVAIKHAEQEGFPLLPDGESQEPHQVGKDEQFLVSAEQDDLPNIGSTEDGDLEGEPDGKIVTNKMKGKSKFLIVPALVLAHTRTNLDPEGKEELLMTCKRLAKPQDPQPLLDAANSSAHGLNVLGEEDHIVHQLRGDPAPRGGRDNPQHQEVTSQAQEGDQYHNCQTIVCQHQQQEVLGGRGGQYCQPHQQACFPVLLITPQEELGRDDMVQGDQHHLHGDLNSSILGHVQQRVGEDQEVPCDGHYLHLYQGVKDEGHPHGQGWCLACCDDVHRPGGGQITCRIFVQNLHKQIKEVSVKHNLNTVMVHDYGHSQVPHLQQGEEEQIDTFHHSQQVVLHLNGPGPLQVLHHRVRGQEEGRRSQSVGKVSSQATQEEEQSTTSKPNISIPDEMKEQEAVRSGAQSSPEITRVNKYDTKVSTLQSKRSALGNVILRTRTDRMDGPGSASSIFNNLASNMNDRKEVEMNEFDAEELTNVGDEAGCNLTQTVQLAGSVGGAPVLQGGRRAGAQGDGHGRQPRLVEAWEAQGGPRLGGDQLAEQVGDRTSCPDSADRNQFGELCNQHTSNCTEYQRQNFSLGVELSTQALPIVPSSLITTTKFELREPHPLEHHQVHRGSRTESPTELLRDHRQSHHILGLRDKLPPRPHRQGEQDPLPGCQDRLHQGGQGCTSTVAQQAAGRHCHEVQDKLLHQTQGGQVTQAQCGGVCQSSISHSAARGEECDDHSIRVAHVDHHHHHQPQVLAQPPSSQRQGQGHYQLHGEHHSHSAERVLALYNEVLGPMDPPTSMFSIRLIETVDAVTKPEVVMEVFHCQHGPVQLHSVQLDALGEELLLGDGPSHGQSGVCILQEGDTYKREVIKVPETEGSPVLSGYVCSERSGRSTIRLELHPNIRILVKTEKVENMFTVPALVFLDTRGAADDEMSKGRLQVTGAIEVDSHDIDNGGHANYEHVSGWSALHNELVDPYGRLEHQLHLVPKAEDVTGQQHARLLPVHSGHAAAGGDDQLEAVDTVGVVRSVPHLHVQGVSLQVQKLNKYEYKGTAYLSAGITVTTHVSENSTILQQWLVSNGEGDQVRRRLDQPRHGHVHHFHQQTDKHKTLSIGGQNQHGLHCLDVHLEGDNWSSKGVLGQPVADKQQGDSLGHDRQIHGDGGLQNYVEDHGQPHGDLHVVNVGEHNGLHGLQIHSHRHQPLLRSTVREQISARDSYTIHLDTEMLEFSSIITNTIPSSASGEVDLLFSSVNDGCNRSTRSQGMTMIRLCDTVNMSLRGEDLPPDPAVSLHLALNKQGHHLQHAQGHWVWDDDTLDWPRDLVDISNMTHHLLIPQEITITNIVMFNLVQLEWEVKYVGQAPGVNVSVQLHHRVQVCKQEGVLDQPAEEFRPDCSSELIQDVEAEYGQTCLRDDGLIPHLDDVGTANGHQQLGLSQDHNPHLVNDGEDHCSHGAGQAVPLNIQEFLEFGQVHLKLNIKLINFPEDGSVGVRQGHDHSQRDAHFPQLQ
jgi:hypothetical protein